MLAVVVAALVEQGPHFGEVAGQFGGGHVHKAQLLDAGRVDDERAGAHLQHFGEGGGVHALVRKLAYFGGFQVEVGHQGVDKGAFAHPRMAGQQAHFAIEQVVDFGHALAGSGRAGAAGVAQAGVHARDFGLVVEPVGVVQIGFVEEQRDGNVVSLGRDQKPVDEPERGGRRHQRDHQQRLVEVGGHDVGMPGLVHRTADDVVAPRGDVRNHSRAFALGFHGKFNVVAHGQRVAHLEAFNLEFAP